MGSAAFVDLSSFVNFDKPNLANLLNESLPDLERENIFSFSDSDLNGLLNFQSRYKLIFFSNNGAFNFDGEEYFYKSISIIKSVLKKKRIKTFSEFNVNAHFNVNDSEKIYPTLDIMCDL